MENLPQCKQVQEATSLLYDDTETKKDILTLVMLDISITFII